ncbi:Aldo/keto reductase [Rickenella mellea]|uniref:Aldo/keto reductase n=1 Tax=Rickenella mellea TaxID=50990 RepID=A0A4Y7QEP2_9AGAM|nr:Aldo/keto reductase [Rickenella mellea]
MSLPQILYGTAWKKERTSALVVEAVLQGFRAIDTAGQPKHYNEEFVGAALQILQDQHGIKREDIWLQTKFTSINGQDTTKPLPYDPTQPIPNQVQTSFSDSLKNLRTTYLDSYILHSPLPTRDGTLEAWRTLGKLQDEGHVRRIGVSNPYDVGTLEALAKERPVQVVQNRWYEGNQWDKEVCAYCKRNGMMYQSFWTLTGSPRLLTHPSLNALAQRHHKTPEQILFRLAQTRGVVPLAGSTDRGRMRDGVETEQIELVNEEEEVQKLTSVTGLDA